MDAGRRTRSLTQELRCPLRRSVRAARIRSSVMHHPPSPATCPDPAGDCGQRVARALPRDSRTTMSRLAFQGSTGPGRPGGGQGTRGDPGGDGRGAFGHVEHCEGLSRVIGPAGPWPRERHHLKAHNRSKKSEDREVKLLPMGRGATWKWTGGRDEGTAGARGQDRRDCKWLQGLIARRSPLPCATPVLQGGLSWSPSVVVFSKHSTTELCTQVQKTGVYNP